MLSLWPECATEVLRAGAVQALVGMLGCKAFAGALSGTAMHTQLVGRAFATTHQRISAFATRVRIVKFDNPNTILLHAKLQLTAKLFIISPYVTMMLFAERAEALDVLYLLRCDTDARRALAASGAVTHLASLLDTCTATAPGLATLAASKRLSQSTAAPEAPMSINGQMYSPDDVRVSSGRAASPGSLQAASPQQNSAGSGRATGARRARKLAASVGLFPEPQAAGAAVLRDEVVGKAVRLLVYMARDSDPAVWPQVRFAANERRRLSTHVDMSLLWFTVNV